MNRNASVPFSSEPTRLILFSPDSLFLDELKPFSAGLPFIEYWVGYGPEVTAKAKLDALWVTIMGAVELFGAVPLFPLHEAFVLKTPAARLQRGFPPYGIAGVAISPDDPRTPEHGLQLMIPALLKAVRVFNSMKAGQILRVGILPEDLALKALSPVTVFGIIRHLYDEQNGKHGA